MMEMSGMGWKKDYGLSEIVGISSAVLHDNTDSDAASIFPSTQCSET